MYLPCIPQSYEELGLAASSVSQVLYFFCRSPVFLIYLTHIAELQIEPNQNHLLKNLERSIFAWLLLLFVVCHADDSSDVTLVFEDADW